VKKCSVRHTIMPSSKACRFRGSARPSIRRAPVLCTLRRAWSLIAPKRQRYPPGAPCTRPHTHMRPKQRHRKTASPRRCTQSRRAARYREGNRTWLHASGAPGAQASERRLLAAGDRVEAADQRGSGPHACEQCEAKFELPAAKFELPSIRGSPFLRCSWQASYLLVHAFIVHTPKAGRFVGSNVWTSPCASHRVLVNCSFDALAGGGGAIPYWERKCVSLLARTTCSSSSPLHTRSAHARRRGARGVPVPSNPNASPRSTIVATATVTLWACVQDVEP
jgi:hypothetical protein